MDLGVHSPISAGPTGSASGDDLLAGRVPTQSGTQQETRNRSIPIWFLSKRLGSSHEVYTLKS